MLGCIARQWRRLGACVLPGLALLVGWSASTAAVADTFRLGGTGNALATMRALGDAFARKEPGFALVVVPNLGSSGGLNALKGGAIDLAVLAKPLAKADEAAGLVAVALGRTPLVLATSHEANALSLAELADAYAGRMTHWPGNVPLRVVLRPPADSDTASLRALAPTLSQALDIAHKREGLVMAITDQEAADVLERVPGSLGTATLAIILSESRRLRALSLDGVSPTKDGRPNPAYPMYKPVLLASRGEPGGQLGRFVTFVRGAEGARILERNGYLVER